MLRSAFYKIFPVPKFLAMPSGGIDISDQSVRFVELIERRGGLVLGHYGERSIPEGAIVSGEIKQPEVLKKIFADLRKELSVDFITIALPEEQAYLLHLSVGTESKSEIRGMLEFQLEENVPIPPTEAVFDYDIVPEKHVHKGTTQVAVSAVSQRLIDAYANAFEGTGLTPMAFEVEPESIARSVVPSGDRGTYMVMDFGRTRTGIFIVSGGAVSFTSTVSVGGYSLTRAIAKELGISIEEAERIKRTQGFVRTQDNEKLFTVLMSTISLLRDEVVRHYNYWHEHPNVYGERHDPITKVILCGGDANLNGFAEFLSLGLAAPVELAQVMQNVNSFDRYVPEIPFSDSLRYATAVGLALRRLK